MADTDGAQQEPQHSTALKIQEQGVDAEGCELGMVIQNIRSCSDDSFVAQSQDGTGLPTDTGLLSSDASVIQVSNNGELSPEKSPDDQCTTALSGLTEGKEVRNDAPTNAPISEGQAVLSQRNIEISDRQELSGNRKGTVEAESSESQIQTDENAFIPPVVESTATVQVTKPLLPSSPAEQQELSAPSQMEFSPISEPSPMPQETPENDREEVSGEQQLLGNTQEEHNEEKTDEVSQEDRDLQKGLSLEIAEKLRRNEDVSDKRSAETEESADEVVDVELSESNKVALKGTESLDLYKTVSDKRSTETEESIEEMVDIDITESNDMALKDCNESSKKFPPMTQAEELALEAENRLEDGISDKQNILVKPTETKHIDEPIIVDLDETSPEPEIGHLEKTVKDNRSQGNSHDALSSEAMVLEEEEDSESVLITSDNEESETCNTTSGEIIHLDPKLPRNAEDEQKCTEKDIIEITDSSTSRTETVMIDMQEGSGSLQGENKPQNAEEEDPDSSDVDILTFDEEQDQLGSIRKSTSTRQKDAPEVQSSRSNTSSGVMLDSEIITLSPEPDEVTRPHFPSEQETTRAAPTQWTVSDIDIHVMPPSMVKSEPLDDMSEYGGPGHNGTQPGTVTPDSDIVIKSEPIDMGYGDQYYQNAASSSPRLGQTVGSISIVNAAPTTLPRYECPQCTRPFKLKSSVRKHMKKKRHHGIIQPASMIAPQTDIQYQCPECDASFQNREELRQHMEAENHALMPLPFTEHSQSAIGLQNSGPPYKCKKCYEHFSLRSELRQHLREKHGVQSSSFMKIKAVANPSSHECNNCKVAFKYPSELQRHIDRKSCVTRISVENRTSLNSHDVQDWSGPPFKCVRCKIVFTYKNNLIKHLEKHHVGVDQQLECPNCEDKFPDQERLHQHITDDHDQQYACRICDHAFVWKQSLKRHMIKKHQHDPSEKLWFESNHKSPSKTILESQLLKGQGAVFKCVECMLAFKEHGALQQHMSTHHGSPKRRNHAPPNYACVYCPKKVIWKKSMERHIRSHHPGRPLVITKEPAGPSSSVQSHGFHQATGLSQHSFCCKYCKLKFRWKHSLKRHMVSLHPGKPIVLPQGPPTLRGPFHCKYCHMKFGWPSSLRRHVRQKHPGKPFAMRQDPSVSRPSSVSIKTEPGVSSDPVQSSEMNKPKVAYQCPQCRYIYARKHNIHVHMRKQNHFGTPVLVDLSNQAQTKAMGLYQCPVCSKSYFERAKLKKHFTITGHRSKPAPSVKPVGNFHCKLCNVSFTQEGSLKRHMRESGHAEATTLNAIQTDVGLQSDSDNDHRRQYCKVCRVMLKSTRQYQRHLLGPLHAKKASKARTNLNVNTCPKCDKGFASIVTLQRHQRMMNHKVAASQIIYLPAENKELSYNQEQPVNNRPKIGMPESNDEKDSMHGDRSLTIIGRKCLLCRKRFGDPSKLLVHLNKTKHKTGHLRLLQKPKLSQKGANQAAKTQAPYLKCLVCLRNYSDNRKLNKHLYATKHRYEHDRRLGIKGNALENRRRFSAIAPTVTVSNIRCFLCGNFYGDEKKLSKHLTNTGHREKHYLIKDQAETFATKSIDLTKEIPEDQCLKCGKITGSSHQLYKHLYNTKHREEHDKLKEELPQLPFVNKSTEVNSSESNENSSGQKCLLCNAVYPDSRSLNQHLNNSNHKEEHDKLNFKHIMKAVVAAPKVCVEKLSPEKSLQDVPSGKSVESTTESPRKVDVSEKITSPKAKIARGGKKDSRTCLVCGKVCRDRKTLRKHLWNAKHRVQHDEMEQNVNQSCVSQKIVVKTSLFNFGLFKVTCAKCKRRFPSKNLLNLHMKKVHGSRKSSTVGKTSKKESDSTPAAADDDTSETAGAEENVQCYICDKQYPRLSNLKKHVFNAHKQLWEPQDGAKHSNESESTSVKDGVEETVQCYLCEKQYPRLSNLKKHIYNAHKQLWTPQDPSATPQNSSATPQNPSATPQKVEKTHVSPMELAEDECFQCHLCEKQFTNITRMKQHVFTAHGQFLPPDTSPQKVKPSEPSSQTSSKCEFCDQEFLTITRLKQHTFAKHKKHWQPHGTSVEGAFPSALPVSPEQQQRIKQSQPMVLLHKLVVDPELPCSEQDAEEQVRNCEAREAKSLYTQLKKHLKVIADLSTEAPEDVETNLDVESNLDMVENADEDGDAPGPTPSKRPKIEVESKQNTRTAIRNFKCPTCDQTFGNAKNLRRHRQSRKHKWYCPLCYEPFFIRSQLTEHKATQHQLFEGNQNAAEETSLVGNGPDVSPSKATSYAPPTGEMEPKGIPPLTNGDFKCQTCDLTFTDATNLRKHRKSKKHRWICPVCNVSYSMRSRFITHKATCHNLFENSENVAEQTSGIADSDTTKDQEESVDVSHTKNEHPGLLTTSNGAETKEEKGPEGLDVSKANLANEESDNESEGLPILPQLDESDEEEEDVSVYKCNLCSERFSSKKDLIQHKEVQHVIFKCNNCPQRFDSELELLNHMLMHRSSTPLMKLENRNGANVPVIAEHESGELDMSVEEGSPMYNPWSDEDNAEPNPTKQETAQKKDTGGDNIPNEVAEDVQMCPQCEETFSTDSDLEQHILRCHVSIVPQVYQCDICSTTFKHKSGYMRHMARGKHKQHNMQHKGSPSQAHESDVDGESSNDRKTSSENSDLGLPEDIDRPYKCLECGSCFIYKASYTRHMKEGLHNVNSPIMEQDLMVEKRYECPECASTFLYEKGLVNHIKSGQHTVCKICRQTFTDSMALRAHMSVHGSTPLVTSALNDIVTTPADQTNAGGEIEDNGYISSGLVMGEMRAGNENASEMFGQTNEASNVFSSEIAAYSDKPCEEANRTDCVSPSELLEWIAQAKEGNVSQAVDGETNKQFYSPAEFCQENPTFMNTNEGDQLNQSHFSFKDM